jgi:AAA ATPase domain
MDEVRNPFAPSGGNQPPELAGRQDIIERARIVLARVEQGRNANSFMMVGLRGVGKTVLLNKFLQMAEDQKLRAHLMEVPEDKALAELLMPPLRKILLDLDRVGATSQRVKRAIRVVTGFAKGLKIKGTAGGDFEFGHTGTTEPGVADSGDLENDLPEVLVAIAEAAKARKTAVVLLIDELQYIKVAELSALIMGIHKVSQKQLPLVLIAAGLPQLVGNMGQSKSYAERLFEFPEIGPLNKIDASQAINGPVTREGEHIEKAAVDAILTETLGYPYFLQAWGKFTWNQAVKSPIKIGDVNAARPKILQWLDEGFFRVRFDRLTPGEKRYLRAMAELGQGPHRSGDIADTLEVKVSSVAPTRNNLIKKGMIYAPSHGDTAFTVPLFDSFMKRKMPTLPPKP